MSVGQTTRQRINYFLCQRSNFNEWAQSAYLLVPSGDGIFYSLWFKTSTQNLHPEPKPKT